MNGVVFFTFIAGFLAAVIVVLGWTSGVFFRHLQAERQKNELVGAALATIDGHCYRWDGTEISRIDGKRDQSGRVFNFSYVFEGCADEHQAAIRSDLKRMVEEGTGFNRRVTAGQRVLGLTGHRLTADPHPPVYLVWISDVTVQQKAGAERDRADQNHGMLRALIDRLPFPVWWREEGAGAESGNRQFRNIEGIEAALRKLSEKTDKSGTLTKTPLEVTVKEGKRFFDLVQIPVEDGRVGFALDRSEAMQLQGEMTRLSLGHQQVLETIGAAIAIWGPDTRLAFNNTAFEKLWGLDHEWLQSEPSLSEVLDNLRDMRAFPEYADFRKFKAEQVSLFTVLDHQREDLLHLPDERTLRLRITRHPFGGLTYIYEDVTDRLALERSYNTLTEVQRETLDNLFEGIAVFGSDGRLRLWNPTFADMWEWHEPDLAGRPHISQQVDKQRDFFEPEVWEQEKSQMIDRITGHVPFSTRLERLDGRVLDINGVPLPDGNMLLTHVDVTDTVRVQRALLEKEEALRMTTRLKSEFVANVSYELRTPLNAIIGFSEILANQYFGPLNERQLDYARSVLSSSQRLLSLINDILDLAAIEAGQLELERELVDVHMLLASVLPVTRERAANLQLTVAFDCPTDIGMVIADERRLRQSLYNLLINAIKFTPAHGTITVSAFRKSDEIALVVQDSGVGIDPQRLNKVFEKFERAHSTRVVGAGLGLPLVKSFIELHGGRVEIESVPNEGTRVTCWLPSGAGPIGIRSTLPHNSPSDTSGDDALGATDLH